MSEKNKLLRELPSISSLLETNQLREASEQFGQTVVSHAARKVVDGLRKRIHNQQPDALLMDVSELANQIARELNLKDRTTLKPVINATGILLHTGLGRAPLAAAVMQAVQATASGYCNVELNLDSGQRTQRSENVNDLLCQLTGAEAAHVVNNNAGATALVLAALATHKEVIVSHGELIEIGGGYRLPDVIETFGARLRPVGTTNKTRPSDYEQASGDQTGAILVVHPSNYQISGFTQTPPLADIVEIARRRKIPLVHDIGSGAMIDFAQFGCHAEPIASTSIQIGADLVLFSGDKLLGGPQAGIIVGSKALIDQIARHPLNRALRIDKMTLAALRATLQLYCQTEQALESIPLLQCLQTSVEELKTRAEQIVNMISSQLPDWKIVSAEDEAFVGGGSAPQQAIASWRVILSSATDDIGRFARQLRIGSPAVVARVQNDQIHLGLHSVFSEQDQALADAIVNAAQELAERKMRS